MIHSDRRITTASPTGSARRTGALPVAVLAASAAAALASAAALSARLVSIAPDRAADLTRVEEVVELGVLAAGAAIGWWLTAGLAAAAACASARVLGRRWAAGERFVAQHAPGIVRRGLALAVGAGVGVVSAVVPAGAQSTQPPADLGWVATQVAAIETSGGPGPVVTATAAAPGGATPPGAPERVTVQPGDSLWSVAADHLPAGATAAAIAAAWPGWYETNRVVVGDDPDRIRPGQVLTAPVDVPGDGS